MLGKENNKSLLEHLQGLESDKIRIYQNLDLKVSSKIQTGSCKTYKIDGKGKIAF